MTMNAKNYLQQVFFLNQRINDSLQDLKELRAKAVSIGSIDTTKEKVQSGKLSDNVGNSIPIIVDLDAEINANIEEYRIKKREIEATIDKVTDCKARAVLFKRYIHFHEWVDIADSLSKTVHRIYQIHRAGLNEIGKII